MSEAKDRLIKRMRNQYEVMNGRQPDAKAARAIEREAQQTAERVGRQSRSR